MRSWMLSLFVPRLLQVESSSKGHKASSRLCLNSSKQFLKISWGISAPIQDQGLPQASRCLNAWRPYSKIYSWQIWPYRILILKGHQIDLLICLLSLSMQWVVTLRSAKGRKCFFRDGLDELQAAYLQQRVEQSEGLVQSIPEVAMASSLPKGSLLRTGTASTQAAESAVQRTLSTSSSAYFAEVSPINFMKDSLKERLASRSRNLMRQSQDLSLTQAFCCFHGFRLKSCDEYCRVCQETQSWSRPADQCRAHTFPVQCIRSGRTTARSKRHWAKPWQTLSKMEMCCQASLSNCPSVKQMSCIALRLGQVSRNSWRSSGNL